MPEKPPGGCLLAKSLSVEEIGNCMAKGAAKYTGHICFVMQAADVLIEEMGVQILRQLGLEGILPFELFAQTVRLGAYLHDWGKANRHFQEMVWCKTLKSKAHGGSLNEQLHKEQARLSKSWKAHGARQMLRHEVISGILALYVPSFREWLEQCPNAELMIAAWAAMGHHLRIGLGENKQPSGEISFISQHCRGDELTIYTHDRSFRGILEMGQKALSLPSQLPELPQEVWSRDELLIALKTLRKEFSEYHLSWEKQKFAAAVKATVIAADLAGSALPLAAQDDFKIWMRQVLNLTLEPNELNRLVQQRLGENQPYQFQTEIAESLKRLTVVIAGCGTGKTGGAYLWAERWASKKKLFFCYPTTGTASQGFIDYVNGTEIEAELMHSRADLDRELLFSEDSDDLEEDVERVDSHLAAFQAWRKKLIVCTVDTVLGLIQNNRKPLFAWPAIANAAFVFDEVHAYDRKLFGALLKFIKTFRGAPILLMSASFTDKQLQKIRDVMAEIGEEVDEPIEGPKELENLPRYDIQLVSEINDPAQDTELWKPVIAALAEEQKVLWVTNSVQSCIDLYRAAKQYLSEHFPTLKPLIYHSRFRYKDRLEKHQLVVNAFAEKNAVLAIATQVCEMSLDLSADLLVSAMAPAAALIQRLGRLNRRMKRKEDGTKLALIYPWTDKHPYKTEIKTGENLLEQIARVGVSQADLAEIAARLNARTEGEIHSRWLDDTWCTYSDSLREGGGTVTVLLEQDMAEIRAAAEQKKVKNKQWTFTQAAQAWSVPIRIPPDPRELGQWQRCKFYRIAPTDKIFYSEETGAETCKS
ncbi:MAG: CRISPR-associated helicase Cas3' [Chroococcidiopsidaceae cyanobacterium CP_BM_ER_R8_30]|nr:CRISPR-associated helicase Cas3' [Chroococcidiopsidaceae cyanobacterium CP_BM_ER_R8_30]